MNACLPEGSQRWPTMAEAVEIATNQLSRQGQMRQIQYMRETQGDKFADQVGARLAAAGGVRKK